MRREAVLVRIGIAGLSILVGLLAVQAFPLPGAAGLPAGALVVGLVVLATIPIALERWPLALAGFLIWLVVEDLVRKLTGNDIRVFFVKDLIFLLLLGGLFLDRRSRGVWRAATGPARAPLYALIAWAVVMSIPVLDEDWRLPLVGLRLHFLYLPLVVAGYLVARRAQRLSGWLAKVALLGAVASAVGIVQAVIGPSFLAPDRETPGLGLLVTVRGFPDAEPVYRPAGTFVSSGRFAQAALIALAVALAAVLARRGRPKATAILPALVAGGAAWVAGGRASFVVAACLVAVAAVAPGFGERRPGLHRSVLIAGVIAAAVIFVALFAPSVFSSRLSWYSATLDPSSPHSEWASRWASHAAGTVRGIQIGGAFGQGTGVESLGKQYLTGDPSRSPEGLYQVEAGFGSIAVEWGVLGLGLWLAWTISWVRRQWRCVQAARDGPMAAVGLVLFAWVVLLLFVQFFGGLAIFQNYYANAYFWLVSGVIFALPEAAAGLREAPRGEREHADVAAA